MSRSRSILGLAAGAALAALGWLAWHSTREVRSALDPEKEAALAAPSPELLAALDSAGAQAEPAIESQAGTAREALEVRKIQTRSASIAVQPPKVESENRGMIIVWCYLASSHAGIEPEEIQLLGPDGQQLRGADAKQKGTFRGLVGGPFSVLVRDPRFESVRVDSVATGSHVLIDLLGTVRLRPIAVDAETGAAIAASTLRLVGFGREKEIAPDDEGWFSGLPGGDLELHVRAPGYEESKLVARGLLVGESREVELRFSRAGEIRGVVVSEAGGAPVPNVYVELDWVTTPDVLRQRMNLGDLNFVDSRFRPARPAETDSQGRFTIGDLPLGEYLVAADQGLLLEPVQQRVVLAVGDSAKEVVLRVPASCLLSGRLDFGGEDAIPGAFGSLSVVVQLLGAPEGARAKHTEVRVQSDGRFRFTGGLPVRRVAILLAMHPQVNATEQVPGSPATRVLGELALHPGENECSFDVSSLLPGFADVEVVASGMEIDDGELLVVAREGGEIERYGLPWSLGQVGPLPPGDYWVLASGNDGWLSSTPVALHIERGARTKLRLELRLVRGTLVVQDEDGAALAEGTVVGVRSANRVWPGPAVGILPRVGENGELALALEPGSYLIGRQSETALEWGLAGPAQAVLRLARQR